VQRCCVVVSRCNAVLSRWAPLARAALPRCVMMAAARCCKTGDCRDGRLWRPKLRPLVRHSTAARQNHTTRNTAKETDLSSSSVTNFNLRGATSS